MRGNLLRNSDLQLCQKKEICPFSAPLRLCASLPLPFLGERARQSHGNPQRFNPHSVITNWTKLLFDPFDGSERDWESATFRASGGDRRRKTKLKGAKTGQNYSLTPLHDIYMAM
jgi:hypothetical protein